MFIPIFLRFCESTTDVRSIHLHILTIKIPERTLTIFSFLLHFWLPNVRSTLTACTHCTPYNVSNDAGVPLCPALVLHTFISTLNISSYECHWCGEWRLHCANRTHYTGPYLFSFNIFHNLNLWSTKNFHFFSHSKWIVKIILFSRHHVMPMSNRHEFEYIYIYMLHS